MELKDLFALNPVVNKDEHDSISISSSRVIHGSYRLPEGYTFAPVLHDAIVINESPTSASPSRAIIASFYQRPFRAWLLDTHYTERVVARYLAMDMLRLGSPLFRTSSCPYSILSLMQSPRHTLPATL